MKAAGEFDKSRFHGLEEGGKSPIAVNIKKMARKDGMGKVVEIVNMDSYLNRFLLKQSREVEW